MDIKNVIAFAIIIFLALAVLVHLSGQNKIKQTNYQNVNVNSKESPKKINLATANKEKLKQIPGIGELAARKIINYRERNMINSADDLQKILGRDIVNQIQPYTK